MEQKTQTRKRGWIVASIALIVFSVCLITSLACALVYNSKAQNAVGRAYEQKIYDLGDNMSNIEVNLSKLMISPECNYTAGLLTDIYSEALAAGKALSDLPVDWYDSQGAAGFLNKVADFSISYQQSLLSGKDCKAFGENVENLYVTARRLNAEISDAVSGVAQHNMDIRKITADKPFTFRSGETITDHNPVEYPELIYDGPFSDGRADEQYKCFCDEESIELKAAKDIAVSALGEDFGVTRVLSAGKAENEPMYELTVEGARGEAYFTISERGGKIVNMSVARQIGNIMLGEESAKACAKEFASRFGYDVQPVWYLSSGGAAYINLAPVIDDVVYYTDLVKVKVALDNGEILGLEAKNYCLNHEPRNLKLTMNKSAVPTLVDSRLSIVSVRGALIPLENNRERLCYEVACEYKGLEYFVYLDSSTGETVKIMRTVDSEQGSLVM